MQRLQVTWANSLERTRVTLDVGTLHVTHCVETLHATSLPHKIYLSPNCLDFLQCRWQSCNRMRHLVLYDRGTGAANQMLIRTGMHAG